METPKIKTSNFDHPTVDFKQQEKKNYSTVAFLTHQLSLQIEVKSIMRIQLPYLQVTDTNSKKLR